MTSGRKLAKRGYLRWGIGIGVGIGFVVAFMFQALIPAIAKVPGLLICGGDELALVMRRPTSYGLCAGEVQRVHYVTILLVSTVVWSVVFTPLGVVIARWIASKAEQRPR